MLSDFFRHKDKARWDYFVLNWHDHWSENQKNFSFTPCIIAEVSWGSWHIVFPFSFANLPISCLLAGERKRPKARFLPRFPVLSFLFLTPQLGGGQRATNGLAMGFWGSKWPFLLYLKSSFHFLKHQSPQKGACLPGVTWRVNDRASWVWLSFHCYIENLAPSLTWGWDGSLLSPGRWPIRDLCCIPCAMIIRVSLISLMDWKLKEAEK